VPKNTRIFYLVLFLGISSGNSFASALTTGELLSTKLLKNNINGTQTLLNQVPLEINTATKVSPTDPNTLLEIRVILPWTHQTELNHLLKSIYTPGSADYQHYLSDTQFMLLFGPSKSDISEISQYLTAQGMWVDPSSVGCVLKVKGTVAAAQQAFGVEINNYEKSDKTRFYATAKNAVLPAYLAGKIAAIGGFDNINRYQSPLQQNTNNLKPAFHKMASGPNGFLGPPDIIKAYNLTNVPSDGSYQTVALYEEGEYNPSDITAYEDYFNLPHVPIQTKIIDNSRGVASIKEITGDIELLIGTAPGLQNILVYESSNGIDEWNAIAYDNIAKIISCSFGENEFDLDYSDVTADFLIFQKMAGQGQEVLVASGDYGAVNQTFVDEPSAQPYVTAVGFTRLAFNADGSYGNEIGSTISSGGISKYESIPDYQQGMISQASKGSTTFRNVPDVAMVGDTWPTNYFSIYVNGAWVGQAGGSSYAAPMWAGFLARVNQGRANAGEPPLGFANPALYAIAQSSDYTSDFHDITSGNNGYYPAVPGYDLVTGIGSPNGLFLYNDLVSPLFAPTNLTAAATSSTVSLSWQASNNALWYNVKRSNTNGGPYITITSGLQGTSYIDNNVVAGNVYYYVVSAANSIREGQNSAQVSAQPQPPHMITSSGGLNGYISPLGNVFVNYGSSQMYTITPYYGYDLVQLLVDGRQATATLLGTISKTNLSPNIYTYTFPYVTSNHTIQAIFKNPALNFNLAGYATATSNPAGFNCTSNSSTVYTNCSAKFSPNSAVSVTLTTQSYPINWGIRGCRTTDKTCTVTLGVNDTTWYAVAGNVGGSGNVGMDNVGIY